MTDDDDLTMVLNRLALHTHDANLTALYRSPTPHRALLPFHFMIQDLNFSSSRLSTAFERMHTNGADWLYTYQEHAML